MIETTKNRIARKLIVCLDKNYPLIGQFIIVDQETGRLLQAGYKTKKEALADFPEAINSE